MVVGFVFISTAPTKDKYVYNELSKIKEIAELNLLMGDYDLIAKIESESYDSLAKIVIDRIRTINGVIDTETLTEVLF